MKKLEPSVYRVLDANANRLREALRVCEDVSRFILASPSLSRALKKLRHEATQTMRKIPSGKGRLMEARDSEHDLGRKSLIKSSRALSDILSRNFKRAQEASRVLEEFLKMLAPALSPALQKIRFQLYDLEKKTFAKLASLRSHKSASR